MTAFAQIGGDLAGARWSWEIKTVNAKGLDLRLRLPSGFDTLEADARRRIAGRVHRGTCHAALGVSRDAQPTELRVDVDKLQVLVDALAKIARPSGIGPATLDGLLQLRGIVETVDRAQDEDQVLALRAACYDGLDAALDALVRMREGEGAALHDILQTRLAAIGRLTRAADAAPQRRPEAVRNKLAASIAALADRHGLEPERLHAEALLLAAKADVREELDRLAAHVVAAEDLLAGGGAIGRRLDFLAQEMAREASTFCAKVNDAALTAIGLELRVEIEQFREQVQNIE